MRSFKLKTFNDIVEESLAKIEPNERCLEVPNIKYAMTEKKAT